MLPYVYTFLILVNLVLLGVNIRGIKRALREDEKYRIEMEQLRAEFEKNRLEILASERRGVTFLVLADLSNQVKAESDLNAIMRVANLLEGQRRKN